MKKVIATLAMVALFAGAAMAADIAKDPAVYVEGVYTPGDDINNRGDVAVVGLYEGTFTDLSGYYLTGYSNAGYTPDLFLDPLGGVDYSSFLQVLVSTSDNWWGTDFGTEIPVLAAYMDGGGRCIVVGQDWLYGSGDYGFASTYLGMAGAVEDLNYGDEGMMDWTGTAGGPLDGLADSLLPCFEANPWFTDMVDPSAQGLAMWGTPMAPGPQEGGCAATTGMLSTVEFGCGNIDVVGNLAAWFTPTATEEASFSTLKTLY